MRLHRNQFVKRLIGTFMGIGFFAIAASVYLSRDETALPADSDRALWYGVTLVIAGAVAVIASWAVPNPNDVWCRQPRRWHR